MTKTNPMIRTIENIVETNLHGISSNNVTGKRLFQIVKYVTGKNKADHTDYELNECNNYYSFDSYEVRGRKGFIRVTLEPLFQVVK